MKETLIAQTFQGTDTWNIGNFVYTTNIPEQLKSYLKTRQYVVEARTIHERFHSKSWVTNGYKANEMQEHAVQCRCATLHGGQAVQRCCAIAYWRAMLATTTIVTLQIQDGYWMIIRSVRCVSACSFFVAQPQHFKALLTPETFGSHANTSIVLNPC